MTDKTSDIAEMIVNYTDQIERYEDLSTWFAAFTIICILSVIIFSAVLIVKQKRENDMNKPIYNILLSGLYLVIPSITTLYLYVFAMNMRKVALYRGYLSFLEEQWNKLTGLDLMLFDQSIIGRFFSFQSFLVNGLGPAVMALFLVLSTIIGFGISIYFLRKLSDSKIKSGLKMLVCTLLIVCILFDGLCTYYLSTNNLTTKSVTEYCYEKGDE